MGKPKSVTVSVEKRKKALYYWALGWSRPNIERLTGLTKSQVRRVTQGIPRDVHPSTIPHEEIERCRRLRDQGMTYAEIARATMLSHRQVENRLSAARPETNAGAVRSNTLVWLYDTLAERMWTKDDAPQGSEQMLWHRLGFDPVWIDMSAADKAAFSRLNRGLYTGFHRTRFFNEMREKYGLPLRGENGVIGNADDKQA